MNETSDPTEDVRRLYEEAETQTAHAMEQLVERDAFGELLARVTENVLAVTRIGNDTADLVVRNLRLAGRRDITPLARQLARTEDKLELVLQEVERLRERLERDREPSHRPNGDDAAPALQPNVGPRAVSAVEQLVRAPIAAVEFANILLTRGRRRDRRDAEGRRLDAPQDDALPLPLDAAAATRCRCCSSSRSSTGPTSSTCGRATRSSSSCSRRASTSSCSTGASPTTRTPTWASTTTSATSCRGACARRCARPARRSSRCSAGASAARCARCTPRSSRRRRAQPRPAHDADRHDGVALPQVGRPRLLRRRPRRRGAAGGARAPAIDWANKLMKPVTNFWTTYRAAVETRARGRRRSARPTSRWRSWVADNPPFPGRAYREWITWMYKENRLVTGRCGCAAAASTCATDRAEPARRHRRRRPHRAAPGHAAAARPGRRARTSRTSTGPAATSA